jgi:hypothetical protein
LNYREKGKYLFPFLLSLESIYEKSRPEKITQTSKDLRRKLLRFCSVYTTGEAPVRAVGGEVFEMAELI